MIVPVTIFVLSYALIAARRVRWIPVGRPAGALLGAVAMVASGTLTPGESHRAVDADTIVLLFGMMLLTAYLERAGMFVRLAGALMRRARTPRGLLVVVALASGALSAVLVNDTVCLFFTPVVILLCGRLGLPMGPYLVALATSSNIGCAATLVGNPQNMIIGSQSGMSFLRFAAYSTPAAAAALAVNVLLLLKLCPLPAAFVETPFAPPATRADAPDPSPRRLHFTLGISALILVGFALGFHLGFTVLTGVALLMLADRREPSHAFGRVDWTLLVFFCGLFVIVAGLAKTGLVERVWAWATPHTDLSTTAGIAVFTLVVVAGSNLVSNVPMVLLSGAHASGAGDFGWVLLGFTSTVAGNLTLIGSAANVIVAERAKDHHTLGFAEHFRVGALSCLASLAVGVPLLWLADRLLR